jgi:hypothetical protein
MCRGAHFLSSEVMLGTGAVPLLLQLAAGKCQEATMATEALRSVEANRGAGLMYAAAGDADRRLVVPAGHPAAWGVADPSGGWMRAPLCTGRSQHCAPALVGPLQYSKGCSLVCCSASQDFNIREPTWLVGMEIDAG